MPSPAERGVSLRAILCGLCCCLAIAIGIAEDRIAHRAINAYKTTVPEFLAHRGDMARFFLDQADEARELAQHLA
jgi:hypothetical protein